LKKKGVISEVQFERGVDENKFIDEKIVLKRIFHKEN